MNPDPAGTVAAQLEVWSMWGDVSRIGFSGHYTAAAAALAAANGYEDRYLWGHNEHADHLEANGRDLHRLDLGVDPQEVDPLELYGWIFRRVASVADERSRGWDVPGWYMPTPHRRERLRTWLRRLRHARVVW